MQDCKNGSLFCNCIGDSNVLIVIYKSYTNVHKVFLYLCSKTIRPSQSDPRYRNVLLFENRTIPLSNIVITFGILKLQLI